MDPLEQVERHSAHNYHPLPVVLTHGDGAWVTDIEGKKYLDLLSAYSALNFGHRHPRLIEAAKRQMDRLTLTSRAFHNDQLGPFVEALAELTGKEMVLPMNSGAEAVETAIKTARKWGYLVKGVGADRARVIVADGNFHGPGGHRAPRPGSPRLARGHRVPGRRADRDRRGDPPSWRSPA